MLMLMGWRLCTSENSIRQISGFVLLMFLLMLTLNVAGVVACYAYALVRTSRKSLTFFKWVHTQIHSWKLILSISSNCVLTVINAGAAVTLLEQRPEKIQALSGIRTHDLCDASASSVTAAPALMTVSTQLLLMDKINFHPTILGPSRTSTFKGLTRIRPLSCGFDSSVGRALHRHRRGRGFESRSEPEIFFRCLFQ